jgi:DNA-binding transcriptional LysR family regulator
MIEDDLALGRLALPYPDNIVTGGTYVFVLPEPEHGSLAALAFRDWLLEEAAALGNRSA